MCNTRSPPSPHSPRNTGFRPSASSFSKVQTVAAAGAIADHLGIPASSLSFHLAQLERAGLVVRVRKSRSLIYSADFAAMNALVGYLMENCCGEQTNCAPACEPQSERNVA